MPRTTEGSNLTYEEVRLETSTWGLIADKNGVVTDQSKPVGHCDLASCSRTRLGGHGAQ
jgi:hypothetical protein